MTATEYAGDMAQQKSSRNTVPGFGLMIRRAREARGWTMAELGSRAGTSASAVNGVEKETRAPSLSLASRLVAALGIKVFLDDPAKPIGA